MPRSGCSRSASRRATGSASGRRTAPSGPCSSSRARASARSSSTSTPRTGQTNSRTRSASPACGCSSPPRRSRRRTISTCSPRCATSCPRWSAWSRSAPSEPAGVDDLRVGRARRRTRRRRRARPAARARGLARLPTTRSTSSTRAARPATRRARRSRTTTSSTTRRLDRRGARLHRGGPRVHPRAAVPLLRHGHRQPRLRRVRVRRWCTRRRASSRSPTLEAIAEERCTSIYGVPTMFIAQLEHPQFDEFDLTSLRTGIMAGAPCPIEVMKRVDQRDARTRDRHRVRHDRDRAGVVHDAARRRHRPAASAPSAP